MTKYLNKFIILTLAQILMFPLTLQKSVEISVALQLTCNFRVLCPHSYLHLSGCLCLQTGFWGFPALAGSLLSEKRISFCHWEPTFFAYLCFPIILINRISDLMTLLSHGIQLWMFLTASCSFNCIIYMSESIKAEVSILGRTKGFFI